MQEDLIKGDLLYFFPSNLWGDIFDTTSKELPLRAESLEAIIAKEGDDLAHLYTLLKKGGIICVKTSSERKTLNSIKQQGFLPESTYLLYPSADLPRFIIPKGDVCALGFSMGAISVGARFGGIFRSFAKKSFFAPMKVMCEYAIFAKK